MPRTRRYIFNSLTVVSLLLLVGCSTPPTNTTYITLAPVRTKTRPTPEHVMSHMHWEGFRQEFINTYPDRSLASYWTVDNIAVKVREDRTGQLHFDLKVPSYETTDKKIIRKHFEKMVRDFIKE